MMISRIAILAFGAALTGCAGLSEEECISMDWETIGFEDGTRGRPVQTISNYRQACGEHGVTADLDGYRAGHSQGVEVYCRPARGFDEGRRGSRYQGVCPADFEPDFLEAYNSGRQLYQLERALNQIDRQIVANKTEQDNIERRLTAIGVAMVSDETSAEERLLMVTESAQLGERYGQLTTEIEALQQDRVNRDIELRDYQQTLAYSF